MLLRHIIGLTLLISGVLSAPSDVPDTPSDKKTEDLIAQAADGGVKTSADSSPKDQPDASSKDKAEIVYSSTKDDQGSKQSQIDEKNMSEKNADVKLEMKDSAEMASPSKPEDKDVNVAAIKTKKDNAVEEISADIVDVPINNEVDDKKIKESFVKAAQTSQTGIVASTVTTTQQKPGVSQLIGNFIYEMMQAPIYLLKAFKDLVGGMLGVRQPATVAVVTASAP